MRLDPHDTVILAPVLHHAHVLLQQGCYVPLSQVIKDSHGRTIGVQLADPFADVTLIHGAPITPALRARMRAALRLTGSAIGGKMG